jgi:hypothetical protein
MRTKVSGESAHGGSTCTGQAGEEIIQIFKGGNRRYDVIHDSAVGQFAEIKVVVVDEEIREIEELGDLAGKRHTKEKRNGRYQLLDVGGVRQAVLPGLGDGEKHPVRVIELSALQLQEVGREGLHADHVVEDSCVRRQ